MVLHFYLQHNDQYPNDPRYNTLSQMSLSLIHRQLNINYKNIEWNFAKIRLLLRKVKEELKKKNKHKLGHPTLSNDFLFG